MTNQSTIGPMVTHTLGHMMNGYTLLVPMNQRVLNKSSKEQFYYTRTHCNFETKFVQVFNFGSRSGTSNITFMINKLDLLWVRNFVTFGIYFIFETKFSLNACFDVKCVLLGRNFDFLGGYCSLPSGYYWWPLVTWWLLLITDGYCSLPLVTAHSHF